jgi:deoxyadenosine/deoxycytidine kinase
MKQIAFFGNIGAGKTSFGKKLSEIYKNVQFIEEDVNENPFLPLFYDDMKKWGFHSSIAMLGLMSSYYKKIDNKKDIIILDQGVEELIAYTNLEYEMGILTKDEYNTYKKLYDNICHNISKIDLYVYFKCDLSVELDRIKNRGRVFEQNLDLDFLYKLQLKYDEYVATLPKDKLIIIDTTNNIDFNKTIQILEEKLKIKFN